MKYNLYLNENFAKKFTKQINNKHAQQTPLYPHEQEDKQQVLCHYYYKQCINFIFLLLLLLVQKNKKLGISHISELCVVAPVHGIVCYKLYQYQLTSKHLLSTLQYLRKIHKDIYIQQYYFSNLPRTLKVFKTFYCTRKCACVPIKTIMVGLWLLKSQSDFSRVSECFCYYDPDLIQSLLLLLRLDSFPLNCARCRAKLPSHEIVVHQTLVMAHGMQLWSISQVATLRPSM